MTNIMKIFAAIMIMVTFVLSGCQSNEQKYTNLKNETIKLVETMEKDKNAALDKTDKYSKVAQWKAKVEVFDKEFPKIYENLKQMETLAKDEIKLSNDLQKFKSQYIIPHEENYKDSKKHLERLAKKNK